MRQAVRGGEIERDWRAVRLGEPPQDRTGSGDRDLLADDGAHRDLETVDLARQAQPRRRCDQRTEQRVGRQDLVDRQRIGVEVEQAPAALDRDRGVAQVGELELAGDMVVVERQLHRAETVRQAQHPSVRPAVDALDTRDQAAAEELEQAVCVERLPHREAERDAAGGRAAAAAAHLGRRQGVDMTHRVVELPDRGETGRERDVGHRHVGGLDEDPRGVRAVAACQGQGTGAELLRQHARHMPVAVAKPARQPFDTLTLDDSVGDQPHRAPDRIGSDIPLRRSGRRVGPAAPARAEPGVLCRRGGRVEQDVLALGGHRRAGRPAVDAGRLDADVEDAVEARVARRCGSITAFVVGVHTSIMTAPTDTYRRVSDMDADCAQGVWNAPTIAPIMASPITT